MRALGILLLSLTPFLLGLDYKSNLNKRSRFIFTFKEFIIFVREQIRFSHREINEIFALAFRNPEFKSFIFCGGDFPFNSSENLAKRITNSNNIRLKPDELNIINAFLSGLGTTDTEGQLNHCDYFITVFEKLADQTRLELIARGRLFIGLSLSLSFAMFIIMI